MQPGERLELFDGEGARFDAQLELRADGGSSGGAIALRILGQREGLLAGERAATLLLAQALAKADKLELVIQKATELGAARIVTFAAERSVVRLDEDRAQSKLARWRKIAEEAARQCGRADVPAIDAPIPFAALLALRESSPELRCVLLDPVAALPLSQAAAGAREALLAIGPEGGFSPGELAAAEARGFLRANLGARVLRTETAGLAALAILQHLAGELG